MGNTIASGSGYSLEVGKNCEKLTEFTSDIIITFKNFYIYKIAYNNSKFGKACLAGTQTFNGIFLAQNKDFNFQWEILQNEDTGEFFVFGNHTKKCDKNSIALVESMNIEPTFAQANKEKLTAIARKFKNNSELAKHINTLRNKKL
jgi:hypothetical protein